MTAKKTSRKGVYLNIQEHKDEFRLRQGNRVLSRHATDEEAMIAFRAEMEVRKGRHSSVEAA